MATTTTVPLDFGGMEIRNVRMHVLSSAPGSPEEGRFYYDSTMGKPRIWDGDEWQDMVGADGTVTGVSGVAPIETSGSTSVSVSITDATPSASGAMSGEDKTKLDGIDEGATQNDTDANLRDRATHTGTQEISTVDGLQGALDDKASNTDLDAVEGKADAAQADATQALSDAADAQSTADDALSGLSDKQDLSEKAQPDGYASLDSTGKVPNSQIPPLAISETFTVANETEMLALTAQRGDVAIRTDTDETFILTTDDPSVVGNWHLIQAPGGGVQSVSGDAPISSTGGVNPTISLDQDGVTLGHLAQAVKDMLDAASAKSRHSELVGDGTATSFAVNHNLGTREVVVQVFRNASPWDWVIADVELTNTNTATVRFGVAPASDAYRVNVVSGVPA